MPNPQIDMETTKIKSVAEIGLEQHIHWLEKSATAQVKNMGEMTVLPYGYLSDAIMETLTVDRTSLHTSLVAAVETAQRTHNCSPDDGNDYDHGAWVAYQNTLTIINSIFKE